MPKLVFIGILILAIAWSAAKTPAPKLGNFASNSSQSGNSYKPPSNLPSDTNNIGYELGRIGQDANRIQQEIDANKAAAESSKLSRDIYFSSGGAGNTNPDSEYLTFTLSQNHIGKVPITGFELKSLITGRGITIPEAVTLPFAGVINEETPVFINPGDTVVLVTGRSPIGYSFRLNKCTGYFGQFQNFTPYLERNCPLPKDEADDFPPNYFNDACIDYIQSISQCTMPLNNYSTSLLQSQCQSFINEKLNYKGCVDEHKNDPDFYKKEWRIYLGQNEELWKSRRETIKLLDLDKKTVGTLTY